MAQDFWLRLNLMEKAHVESICKALANPVRRQILSWLKEPEAHFGNQALATELGVSASTIDKRCGLAQSTVSAHLAVLQRAGLVTTRKISQSVFFKRNEVTVRAFLRHMQSEL